MPLPKLRDYQEVVFKNTNVAFQKDDRVLNVAGTGSGKTVIGASYIHHALSQNQKILFLIHRNILIDQTQEELSNWEIQAGAIAGSYKEDRTRAIQIASCQTLSRRDIDWFDFDLAIFDEAHITAFSKVALELFPKLKDVRSTTKKRKLIGLTATPFRLNPQEKMGDIFEALVCAPIPKKLIEANYLSKPVYYAINGIDISDLKVAKGKDFSKKDLAVRCNTPEAIESAVRHWKKLAAGRRTIAFTVDIDHAKNTAEAFMREGIPAAAVDGTMPHAERRKLYDRLGDGTLLVLCSCEALSEGFNVPAVYPAFSMRGRLKASPNTSSN